MPLFPLAACILSLPTPRSLIRGLVWLWSHLQKHRLQSSERFPPCVGWHLLSHLERSRL